MMRWSYLLCALWSVLSFATLPMMATAQAPEFPRESAPLAGSLELPITQPAPPPEVKMREAVEALREDRRRFVRCRLRDGSMVTGAVIDTGEKGFTLSQGAIGRKLVSYAQLREVPQPVAAPGEHALVGLQWTALVALCVVLTPVMLVAWPLGLIGD
jgi:hypothetical protein